MKEYIAETGGRYTYSDDILNLQELALSMTAIFSECSSFIISGCLQEGGAISSGYLWLGGKVRYFEGAHSVSFPYYICEKNSHETVVYANEINKRGRSCFLCVGSNTIPTTIDPVTGVAPTFIEVQAEYAPRLIDKFFGRYALLLDSPTGRQIVKQNVTYLGDVLVEKTLKSTKEIGVQSSTGHSLKAKIKDSGDITFGAYITELLTSEILMKTDGSFSFMKGDIELAKLDTTGFTISAIKATQVNIGAVHIYQNHITNINDNSDTGSVNINYSGYNKGISRFRNFNVYDGKQSSIPILQVEGKSKTATVNGLFVVNSATPNLIIRNSAYAKTDVKLTAKTEWQDNASETIASIGFLSNTTLDFTVRNILGNILISPKNHVAIDGDLKLKGFDIYSIFVTKKDSTIELGKKVDKVIGKQLSTENFTTVYKDKLDKISGGNLGAGGDGYVTASDVVEALKLKLSVSENLLDIKDKGVARANLNIYSKSEADGRYLQISNKLLELVNLTADEINDLTAEEAAKLKAEKQASIRNNIDAEKKGTGDLKLSIALNLLDLQDKVQARRNISVYSCIEIDKLLDGKLGNDGEYVGVVFTDEMKLKLDGITKGNFNYVDSEGVSHAQTEGYALVSHVVKELKTKAPRLMDGYNTSDIETIAANLSLYPKKVADVKFASIESLFQDYLTYLVGKGMTTAQAQKTLRDKFDVLSTSDVSKDYMRKDGKLSDLIVPDIDSKRLACRNLGAAYTDDYQLKLADSGWMKMNNQGTGTDTSRLYIRQIGSVVSIQGIINTGRRDGDHWGGVLAVIPNQIQPPKYGVRCSHADFNDDHKYNRGAHFVIRGGGRTMHIYESGWGGAVTEISLTYFI